ncbi:MAG: adenosylmethionine--8-amino-7-oxononanoate transaminase [Gammaproteobacteria bacterium]|nr:adenosylmethionine--8-amino-7-oxononanoate transaminase [Gammaproteobacteria bacterium]
MAGCYRAVSASPAWLAYDREHLWHPYSSMVDPPPVFPVIGAAGTRIQLADGRELIDGMASWWSAIHGYNHPRLNDAVRVQLDAMAHVMFGGLTHEGAVDLARQLIGLAPAGLEHVFFADSGSVAVEVAIKMALQYRAARGEPQRRLLTIRGGYHGDTFGAMAICDPITGMHSLFSEVLPQHLFAPRPDIAFTAAWDPADFEPFRALVEAHEKDIAAVVLEPVVQGAGGMWFYHPQYLAAVRQICDEHGLLLIADEIATGFARSGELFGCDHAKISPDIMCLGKALTGGYMTLAATLTSREVADTICRGEPGVFMHGPTFMANPLACACARASIDLLLESDWRENVARIERALTKGLAPCRELANVRDVRVLGAIGVVEVEEPVDMHRVPLEFVERGVWVRPFGRLIYVMPPYIIDDEELASLTAAIVEVASALPGMR